MQKKNHIAVILTILVSVLAVLLVIQIRKYFQPFGISIINKTYAEELKAELNNVDTDMRSEILFNQGDLVFDTDTNTIYITQNKETGAVGEFSNVHLGTHLYWIEDAYFYNMKEAIRSGHEFTFLYITKEGYTEGKLVYTSLPLLSFDKIYSDKTEYFGNLTVSSSSDLEGITYSRKSSYAKVEQKDKSTSPYEREYRIHLLKAEKHSTDNITRPTSMEEAEQELVKNNMQFLDMSKNDDWELHSLYSDASMVREKFASDLWKEMITDSDYAEYAMEMKYTEVVINGKYMGVYGLAEHPDHKSLSLQDKDKSYEDVVPESIFQVSAQNIANYIDYSLFIQCVDSAENMNEKKRYTAKYLEESQKYELFRFPDKLRSLLSNTETEILEDAELLHLLQNSEEPETLYHMVESRWNTLRKDILSAEKLEENILKLENELSSSGAKQREEAIRRNVSAEADTDTNQLLQFLKDRLVYLDEYYKSAMSLEEISTQTEETSDLQDEYRATTLNAGIPTMYLTIDETMGTIAEMRANKGTEAYGNVYIEVPDGYTAEYAKGSQGDYSGELSYIRCRGQSSFNTDKKSYKIELAKNAEIFGMGNSKDWVLIANAFDESMLRNKLAYWMADDIGLADTPKSVYINVVMNGEQLGCFLLAQQPNVGEDRVEIEEPDEDIDPALYSYMVEIMPEGRAVREQNIMAGPYSNIYYHVKYPKVLDTENVYYESIVSSLLNIDYIIYGEDNYNLQELEQYVDIDSFINYYWVQEIFKNTDVMYASTYLYRDVGGKIKIGPVWDFDLSLGAYMSNATEYPQGWYVYNRKMYERLFQNPDFTKQVIERYYEIRPEINHLYKTEDDNPSVIEMYTTQMGEEREKNLDMWGVTLGWKPVKELNFIKQYTMKEADEYIESWLSSRLTWVDENIDSLGIEELVKDENTDGE